MLYIYMCVCVCIYIYNIMLLRSRLSRFASSKTPTDVSLSRLTQFKNVISSRSFLCFKPSNFCLYIIQKRHLQPFIFLVLTVQILPFFHHSKTSSSDDCIDLPCSNRRASAVYSRRLPPPPPHPPAFSCPPPHAPTQL
jgi:hypothetical protein